ncbi:hypothetical protein RDABS01_033917 [Bienertia sinuspersici]
MHGRAVKLGFMSDLLVSTTTIHLYASKDHIYLARKVFDEMPLRSNVSWNALITGYSSQKHNSYENSLKALETFKNMLIDDSNLNPNGVTMVSVLSAVSQLGSAEIGSSVHGYVAKTIDIPEKDVYVGTSLIDMYSKCGCLGIASKVFGTMKERNVLTWTAMATGYALHGKGKEAMELVEEMRKCNVRPNLVTLTGMLSACCHAGLVKEGLNLFHCMEKEFGVAPQIEHYGCIVDLLGKAGHLKEAYDFIVGTHTKLNPVLWRSLLGSCRLHGDVVMGEKIGMIILQLQPDRNTLAEDYVALSNVYALAKRRLVTH